MTKGSSQQEAAKFPSATLFCSPILPPFTEILKIRSRAVPLYRATHRRKSSPVASWASRHISCLLSTLVAILGIRSYMNGWDQERRDPIVFNIKLTQSLAYNLVPATDLMLTSSTIVYKIQLPSYMKHTSVWWWLCALRQFEHVTFNARFIYTVYMKCATQTF